MNVDKFRLTSTAKAAGVHFSLSFLVAALVGVLVFAVWYPYPFRELAGGTELFFLVIGVDLVCGPLLTLVLYSPSKSKRELVVDMGLVVTLQLMALLYGLWTVYLVRPLYLVHEIDRFKLISRADVNADELANLSGDLHVGLFEALKMVSLRDLSAEERTKVMFEALRGGRDYGEHPQYFVHYDGLAAYKKAQVLSLFVQKYPDQQTAADGLVASFINSAANKNKVATAEIRYLPIHGRRDWVVFLSPQGEKIGFLPGDGFLTK